jgi:hypothetical protein
MAGQKREARLRADVPAIHVSLTAEFLKKWMPGASMRKRASRFWPGMTSNYFNILLTKP